MQESIRLLRSKPTAMASERSQDTATREDVGDSTQSVGFMNQCFCSPLGCFQVNQEALEFLQIMESIMSQDLVFELTGSSFTWPRIFFFSCKQTRRWGNLIRKERKADF